MIYKLLYNTTNTMKERVGRHVHFQRDAGTTTTTTTTTTNAILFLCLYSSTVNAFPMMRISSFNPTTTTTSTTTSSTLILLKSPSLLFTSSVRIQKQQLNNNNLVMKMKDNGGGGLEGAYFDGLLFEDENSDHDDSRDILAGLTVPKLKQQLQLCGLKVTGFKQDLVDPLPVAKDNFE